MNFVAIDFETATFERNSACEVGIAVVEKSKVITTKTWLIKPPSYPIFNARNVEIHGITPEDVKNAPEFGDVWNELQDYLYGNLIIAHNASFDAGVLRSCLETAGYFKPKLQYLCSIQLSKASWCNMEKYGLKYLAEIHNINFKHHRAGDDAETCAKISLLACENLNITTKDNLIEVMSKQIKTL